MCSEIQLYPHSCHPVTCHPVASLLIGSVFDATASVQCWVVLLVLAAHTRPKRFTCSLSFGLVFLQLC